MMTFIPPYARNGRQAMIAQAFEPKSLMGLGCACAGAAGADGVMRNLAGLRGLGVDESCVKIEWVEGVPMAVQGTNCGGDVSASGTVVSSAPVDTSTTPKTTGPCDQDPSLWRSGVATNGKCYAYCQSDPSQYYEMGMSECVSASKSGSSIKLTPNIMIIGLVAIGAIILLQQ